MASSADVLPTVVATEVISAGNVHYSLKEEQMEGEKKCYSGLLKDDLSVRLTQFLSMPSYSCCFIVFQA